MATLAPPVGPASRHLLPGSEYGDGSVGIRAGRHLGIDFQPAAPGGEDWINAIEDGTVEALFTEIPPGDKRNPLYPGHTGNVVAIRTANGRVWTYQHGKDFQVTLGQKVKAGDRLCRMWRSGTATGNHLHLGLRINGKFVDPEPVLRKAGAWPIGNTYYTATTATPKEDDMTPAQEAKLDRALYLLDSLPKDVWGHEFAHPRTGASTPARAFLASDYANGQAVHAMVAAVAEKSGIDPIEVERIIRDAIEKGLAAGVELEAKINVKEK